ncbi:unnamed protein product [Calypogeia fissa]
MAETTDLGRQAMLAIEKYDRPQVIVVVVDATRELQLAPLKYALIDVCQPGDKLYLLGILHQVMNPSTSPPKKSTSVFQNILGYKQKADPSPFNGTNWSMIQEERRKKTAEFEWCLKDPELQRLFTSKQVTPIVQIAPGPDRKMVTATQARELRATWVILDRHLKNDKTYLMEELNCNLVLMKPKNQPVMIKIERHEEQYLESPGHFQITLDGSLDLGPGLMTDMSPKALYESVENAVTKSLSQKFSISPAEPPSLSSSSSVQTLTEIKVSTPTLEEHSRFEGQSARTDLSSTSIDSSQGETYLDLDVTTTTQFSDHDIISPAKVTASTGFRGDDSMAAERAAETSGPGISSEILDKVYPESEDDTFTPAMKVGSVGSSSSDAFYKIPGRPSMSTGDLQSLVPKSGSSVATLYRPAPRNASDSGGVELMNILNPTPTTPSGAGTARSVRTLQRSLKDEDLNLQSPNLSNSPIGRVNKFGTQNESDNRLSLLDNTVHGRRKTQRPFAPLCSKCHKPGPKFGSDAIQFTYAQLEEATNNFDQENYIAEGGYGFVYKGRLEGGQEIAVKQYKAASSQGDDEFNSEVEVLKHAQHRNLVILIGYCKENQRRLLVYEFVCNKSLDVHLSAKNVNVLEWQWRWKIAVGAARGLRYLHEECRVGCIVHRDMRPNNILLTHDFVPMVGDFGLARSQPSGDEAEETRVIGTLGYLAPEYAESGSITEKADVYSFGVVLLELITGRKAIDATRARGETCLTEWARPMIHSGMIGDIVDPRLKDVYNVEQVNLMVHAAGRCISKDPHQRPRMSEVLRLLEQDAQSENSLSRGNSVNDLSGEIQSLSKMSRGIRREGSLDSVSSKLSSKGNGASSQSKSSQSKPIAIESVQRKRTSSSERIETRSSSPRLSSKPSSNSPRNKSVLNPKSLKTKLSYGDML